MIEQLKEVPMGHDSLDVGKCEAMSGKKFLSDIAARQRFFFSKDCLSIFT